MHFKLAGGRYKSIDVFEWADIPNLAVITGKNGSGKTQLLELIDWHFKSRKQTEVNHPFHGVKTEVTGFVATEQDVVFLPNIWQLGNLGATNVTAHQSAIDQLYNSIVLNKGNAQWQELSSVVKNLIDKPAEAITKEDISKNLPLDYISYTQKINVNEGLNQLFQHYYAKRADLRNNKIPENEIEKEMGTPPWETLNKLLDDMNFPYSISSPQTLLSRYELKLVKKRDSITIIDFSDLSSGEKMLITLVIWMFNMGNRNKLPKLILLDEPDAHLHPSISNQFFKVVENVLVKEHRVKVILTTHSPSTVAFVSEEYLFEMKDLPPRIGRLQSKDHGINLLTDGIVTVRANSKYVLVEDKNDTKFYNECYQIFKATNVINENIGIIFIPASNNSAGQSGGCTVVRAWVQKFLDEGVDNIFQGLMDLDNGPGQIIVPEPTEHLHFIKRHSLENYLLDPIIVFASSLHLNQIIPVPRVNLEQRDEYKIANLDNALLQNISDFIFSEIQPLLTNIPRDRLVSEEVEFINGVKLNYPKWFLYERGHDLFQKFKSKYRASVAYDKLTDTIVRQRFLPIDLIKTFNDLQSSPN